MQTYNVTLQSPVAKSYRCKRAADSLDIDVEKKAIHRLSVNADIDTSYNIGLIIGASGSGKTTLAKTIFGDDCFKSVLDETKPIIEQFPEDYDYETCAKILSGVGLTQVPCWIRPVYTLSNGQKARAEAALLMCKNGLSVIDEWTSVVDRTVAKVMSHCVQKHARAEQKRIVLLSCHYDVIDWLNPDWVIDCNKGEYVDRRSVWQSHRRSEQLQFTVRETDKNTWRYFSRYHYLSESLPGGHVRYFGLFQGQDQIGFICYANYVPFRQVQRLRKEKMIMHANRIVVHPDYAGIGLGILMTNETAKYMSSQNFRVMCKFSSVPVYKAMTKSPDWRLISLDRQLGVKAGGNMKRKSGFRENIKTYTFEYRYEHKR
jgi:ABC-type multidrug transport system ATPase subunit